MPSCLQGSYSDKFKSLVPGTQQMLQLEGYVDSLLTQIPALAPALATGHIYTASTVDKLFCMVGGC